MLYSIKQKLKETKTVKKAYDNFRERSVYSALKQQRLLARFNQIKRLDPDISNQYTSSNIDTSYLQTKVLGLHAFQMALFGLFINGQNRKEWSITDLGDSSGNHIMYIKNLFSKFKWDTLSVNLDQKAVDKIRSKGLNAIACSIEDYYEYEKDYRNQIITLFQTLEHLENPISILKGVKENLKPEAFIITVPFVRRSKVGLHYLRENLKSDFFNKVPSPENIHIFELSPDDWELLFEYCGWEVKHSLVYYQYKRRIPIISRLLRWYWSAFDFEGFYGCILTKNKGGED